MPSDCCIRLKDVLVLSAVSVSFTIESKEYVLQDISIPVTESYAYSVKIFVALS